MATNDSAARCAKCSGCGYIFLLLQLKHLTADNAAHGYPVQKTKGNEHGNQIRSKNINKGFQRTGSCRVYIVSKNRLQCSGNQKNNKHLRNRINKLYNTLHYCVNLTTAITRNCSVKSTDHKYKNSGKHTNGHGNSGAIHNTDQNVTAIHISTKYMRKYVFPICFTLKLSLRIAENMLFNSKLLTDGILIYALIFRRRICRLCSNFCLRTDNGFVLLCKFLTFFLCFSLRLCDHLIYIDHIRLSSCGNLIIHTLLIF